ncbi:MAG TPA: hypothetical protein VHM65_04140 [Candidatus Lustribacter sp.]|nr:hypothetical protein [Candidatus Lustribacter sp.]
MSERRRQAQDPRSLRYDAPLLDAYLTFCAAHARPFTIPGHKGRSDLVGSVVAGDVPYYAGLDTMKVERGVLATAQSRAAALWGADLARFSTGGSTHGNQALALALASPGDEVVVQRTVHRSVFLGLVLAGLDPVWVSPQVDAGTGVPLGVPAEVVRAALAAHPSARAVLLGDPSYVGTTGDVAGAAAAAHAAGVPLVVDAAWAAHFGFHPGLPAHAIALGADAMVTSAHKMLPAYSQAALVLTRGPRIDRARLDAAVEATATTSPAGAILASIDAARALLARDGAQLLGRLLPLVAEARERLGAVPGVRVLHGPRVDPAKLVVLLAGSGADGVAVERDLIAAGMPVELADRDLLIAIVTMADTAATVSELVERLVSSIEHHRGAPRPTVPAAVWSVAPEQVVSPREAFFAPKVALTIRDAVGRVSGELVAPYPPGVPVLAPGERVTGESVDALLTAREAGTRIAYAADPTLATLLVLG